MVRTVGLRPGGCIPAWLHGLFIAGFFVAAVGTAWLLRGWLVERETTFSDAKSRAQQQVVDGAASLDRLLLTAQSTAQTIADGLSAGVISPAALPARLERVLSDTPGLFGVGVAFEPPNHETQARLAHYYVRRDDVVSRVAVDYDYTLFEHRWYGDPLLLGAGWNEPYVDPTTGVRLAEYALPFYDPPTRGDRAPIGVVRASLDVRAISDAIGDMGLGENGYAFVTSKEGRFVVHPRDDLARFDKTIFDFAWEEDDAPLESVAIHAVQHESGVVDYVDARTRQPSWLFYQSIPDAGWSLGAFVRRANLTDNNVERRELLRILVAGVVALLLLLMSLAGVLRSGELASWITVGVGSLLMALATAGVWLVASQYVPQSEFPSFPVLDQANLEHFLDDYEATSAGLESEAPIYIPTGAFLQSIEFQSSTNVEVTGYIWQRYSRERYQDLERGFVLPEAISVETTPAYQYTDGDTDVVGWYFRATLRQRFGYELYPFDRQEVWLRMWHVEFNRNIVLTPDLSGYDTMNPDLLPGMEGDFVLPGWTLVSSGFDYRGHGYNSNFGISNYIRQGDFPELHFTVGMRRQFLGPFVSKFILLFIVAMMLFALLLIGSKREGHSAWFGFTAMDEVLGCAALFFVLVFDHAALRESLGSPVVMYLENFYFGLYLGILFVTVNAIMFAQTQWRLLQYRDNLLPKLFYWPAYTIGVFGVTLVVFY